ANITGCLETLGWAGEMLVMDGGSTDDTVARAQTCGARVLHRPFDTFARQRNHTLDAAIHPWVFFVDADERVPPLLAGEIAALVATPGAMWSGATVPRRNLMLGAWVRHGGWWPDHQFRLLHRGQARYDEHRDPHELVSSEGPVAALRHPLIHHNYDSVSQLFAKQRAYSLREARSHLADGDRLPLRSLFTGPVREFWRRYVTLRGCRDGPIGLLLAVAMAWSRVEVWRATQATDHQVPRRGGS
ncbi:MAG: glycosyltransferase family 2 protein, partial [Chloroflexota bacterium]